LQEEGVDLFLRFGPGHPEGLLDSREHLIARKPVLHAAPDESRGRIENADRLGLLVEENACFTQEMEPRG
jgi:hypothetical protein